MRFPFTRDSAPATGFMRALIAATLLFVVAACSTTPSSRTAPEGSDNSEPAPATAPEEVPENAETPPVPEQMPEKAPVQTAPAPGAGPTTDSDPRSTTTAESTDAVETSPAPVAATPPAPRASVAPDPQPESVVLNGRVRLDVSQVDDVDDDSVRDTVVYFRPAGASVAASPRNFEITTRRKRLIPDVLVVPVGSTVAFPNDDDILHNVFSVSSAANFDLGLYGQGESKSHTFAEPGLAVIHCNVHHAMRADVLVVDTPFFAQADADGSFSIDGIEQTSGELVAWHPRAGFVRRQITVPSAESLELDLTLVRPRIPDHLDKTGQPYRPERPNRR